MTEVTVSSTGARSFTPLNGLPRDKATVPTVVALVWLLIGPRIQILSISGSSIRLEDFVLAFLAIHVIRHWSELRLSRVLRKGIGLVVAVSLVASGFGAWSGTVHIAPAILYSLRPLEYWVVYPAVMWILLRDRERALAALQRALATVTVLNALVAGLQYLGGFAIGFSKFSYTRGAGLTAGPYELGALAAMLTCYWLFRRQYVLAVLSVASVFLSLSRISLIGVAIGIGLMVVARRKLPAPRQGVNRSPRPGFVIGSTVAVILAIFVAPTVTSQVLAPSVARAKSTSIVASWQSASAVVATTPRLTTSDAFAETAYSGIGIYILQGTSSTDASNQVRFFRWQLLLREVLSSPGHVAFGIGPSFAGPSVDGAYLRFFVETGLVGLVAWGIMLVGWLRKSPLWFISAVISLLIGSIFIDLPFALRPMVVLWVLLAVSHTETAAGTGLHNERMTSIGHQGERDAKRRADKATSAR